MERFVAKSVSAKMHRHKNFGAEVCKGLESLFRVKMVLAKFQPVIRADGQEGDLGMQLFPDFLESGKIT